MLAPKGVWMMMRNDYRRALILLRCNEPGYSGHVRLERRTLMGSMYFMVQTPQDDETLFAALVGRGRDDYYACVLGGLSRDSRGQFVLSHSFDPRKLCGRELEQYQLIAVARTAGGDCRIVLYGNVDGHADLNWERVQQALCLSLAPEAGDCALPRPREEKAQAEAPGEASAPEAVPKEEACAAEAGLEVKGVERLEAIPAQADAAQLDSLPAAEDAPSSGTAADALGVDTSLPWPDEIDELRALFRQSPPLADAPENGYVYISAPLPEGSPYDFLAVGLRAENGLPVAVSYALPATYAPEPPAGLESYRWMGDGNRGWWVSEIDLETGAPI